MRRKNLDLLITTAVVAMNVLWTLLPSHLPVIGIILALPLVFLLPGYTLAEALFHKQSFEGTFRFVISLTLSLGIDIVSGFILNILPTGLRAIWWALFLGLLTVIFSLLVAYLRRKTLADEVQLP